MAKNIMDFRDKNLVCTDANGEFVHMTIGEMLSFAEVLDEDERSTAFGRALLGIHETQLVILSKLEGIEDQLGV